MKHHSLPRQKNEEGPATVFYLTLVITHQREGKFSCAAQLQRFWHEEPSVCLAGWLSVCLRHPLRLKLLQTMKCKVTFVGFCFVLFILLTNSDIIESFDNEKDFLDLIFRGFRSLIHLTVQAASGSRYIPEAHDINIL